MSLEKYNELRKFVAPEFVFGMNARSLVSNYVKNLDVQKCLIVTDTGVINAGWSAQITGILESEGIDFEVFSDITPNPKDYEVVKGVEAFTASECDSIIAVGGGSPMDCAKAIGIVTSNGGKIHDYEGIDMISVPCPPLICIPTTAGTSADVSQFAIITDSIRQTKMAIVSKVLVPDASLIDPETTVTMDPALTAATGMDALVHAFEAFVSNANSSITDMHAKEAVKLVIENLEGAVNQPENQERRYNMMLASMHAGLAFSNACLGLVHAMAHSLGGRMDLPHGECNALLLPHIVDYNFDAAAPQYTKIANIIFKEEKIPEDKAKSRLVDFLLEFSAKLKIKQKLSEMGVTKEMIPVLAENAINDPCIVTNPKYPDKRDVEKIYERAL